MFFGEEAEVGAGGPGGPGAGGAEVGGAGAGGEAPAPPPAAARVRENEYYMTPQIKMPVQMAMPAASKCQERGLAKLEEEMAPYPQVFAVPPREVDAMAALTRKSTATGMVRYTLTDPTEWVLQAQHAVHLLQAHTLLAGT